MGTTFAEIMEARQPHEPHGPQWQVGWLDSDGEFYPISMAWATVSAEAHGRPLSPLYMDAGD